LVESAPEVGLLPGQQKVLARMRFDIYDIKKVKDEGRKQATEEDRVGTTTLNVVRDPDTGNLTETFEGMINLEINEPLRKTGIGTRVVNALLQNADEGLYLYDIQKSAIPYWEQYGAVPKERVGAKELDAFIPAPTTGPRPSQVDMRIRQMAFENDVLSGVITEDTPGVDPGEVRAILADEANKVKEARRMVAGAVQLGEYPVLPRRPRAPTSRRTFTQLIKDAKSARNYRDWYERHRPILHELFGDDMQFFNDIISITSQNRRIDINIDLAMVAYEAIKTGDTLDGKGLLPQVVANLNRLMGRFPSREETLRQKAGKPPSKLPGGGVRYFGGKKIPDMIEAMRETPETVVVDRHIAQLLFDRDSPTDAMVLEAQRLITKVANELRWTQRLRERA
jgi:GNAT superfamily N-acetyltransferase